MQQTQRVSLRTYFCLNWAYFLSYWGEYPLLPCGTLQNVVGGPCLRQQRSIQHTFGWRGLGGSGGETVGNLCSISCLFSGSFSHWAERFGDFQTAWVLVTRILRPMSGHFPLFWQKSWMGVSCQLVSVDRRPSGPTGCDRWAEKVSFDPWLLSQSSEILLSPPSPSAVINLGSFQRAMAGGTFAIPEIF